MPSQHVSYSITLIIKSAFSTVCKSLYSCKIRYLEFALPSIWRISSKCSTKQGTFAQLSSKHMSKIWYQNILRYRNFRVGVFFCFTLYIVGPVAYCFQCDDSVVCRDHRAVSTAMSHSPLCSDVSY